MPDLLASGEAWLAGTFATSAATVASFMRGGLSASVALTLGGDVEVSYGNAAVQTATKKAFFPVADLVLGGIVARPAAGDLLAWVDAGPRVFSIGPWGPDRLPARLVESGLTWEVFIQEVGELSGRKTTDVTLEQPSDAPTRNSDGETTGERFGAVATVKAEVTPLAAVEDVQSGRLLETSKYLVFVQTHKPVAASWRVTVRSGPLLGKHLYVESVTPLPGFTRELMLVCRLAGA